MDGFLDSKSYEFLVGNTIHQVCFGCHEIILRLTNDVSITIFSVEQFLCDNRNILESLLNFDKYLFKNTISKLILVSVDVLEIHFEKNQVLILSNDSNSFESNAFFDGVNHFAS